MAQQLLIRAVGTLPKGRDNATVPRTFSFHTDRVAYDDFVLSEKPTLKRPLIYRSYSDKRTIGHEVQLTISGETDLLAYREGTLTQSQKRNNHFYPIRDWMRARLKVLLYTADVHDDIPTGEWTIIDLHEDKEQFRGQDVFSSWRLVFER